MFKQKKETINNVTRYLGGVPLFFFILFRLGLEVRSAKSRDSPTFFGDRFHAPKPQKPEAATASPKKPTGGRSIDRSID